MNIGRHLLSVAVMFGTVAACTPQQAKQTGNAGLDLSLCVAQHALQGQNIAQIADACLTDVANVVSILVNSVDQQGIQNTKAMAEVGNIRQSLKVAGPVQPDAEIRHK